MVWTIEEVEKGWLAGSRVAVSPEDVVAAFERCVHRTLDCPTFPVGYISAVTGDLKPRRWSACD
jgi:hypothetical protein